MSINHRNIITTTTLIIFLTGLFLFAYLGIYNRYWADDWCYNADFRELGLIDSLKGYLYITTYASNRYSLTLFSALLYYLGVTGVQIMSPINIILLTLSSSWCLINLKKMMGIDVSNVSLVTLAAIATYYSLYLAPHLYQSIYWRSGSLPYFEPIVMGAFIIALITHQSRHRQPVVLPIIVVAIVAFLAGGFSEAACATLITVLIFVTVLIWFFRKQTWAKQSFLIAIVALISTLSAMIVLIASPTTIHRVDLYGASASLTELPSLILKYSYDFVKYSFTDLPLPHLAIMGTSLLLGYLLYIPGRVPIQNKTILISIFIFVVIAFIVIAASFAPSAYIEKTPPHPRTRIIPRFVLTLTLVLVSYALGILIRRISQPKQFYGVAVLVFVLIGSYSIRSIFIASQNVPIYSERAAIWDERERQIESAVAGGESTVYVTAIDGLRVGGIRDFDVKKQGKPGYWINQCAARFYGINAIDIAP